ncbi:MAG TPA: helix-turn-helix transcriptional regulator [Firmicutes bacterium]|jgi:AraC-like DNA-binding protein|nr:helix-turn-helix transcriptional regulator [Bacillota bacterium]
MELYTEDKNFYPGYKMPLRYAGFAGGVDANLGLTTHFRLLFLEEGTGIFHSGAQSFALIAPALLCLSEKEELIPEYLSNPKIHGLFFHPRLINARFSFANIRTPDEALSGTDRQDLWCFRPFLHREAGYFGQLPVDPGAARRIAGLLETINHLSTVQPDDGWPCRTRSCFFELLFLVERIFSAEKKTGEMVFANLSPEIKEIIHYLHINYRNPITISELTKVFHINRTTLAQRFAKETGYTVIKYLTHLRISLAAMILRDTELSISEIIEKIGFNNLTHFGRTFQKYTGFTPSEYRKKYCWML